ncbi:MAG: putative nucleotidyltransferase substrate binding domain-containing protein, partial [Parachlamydiaceae bacterium]
MHPTLSLGTQHSAGAILQSTHQSAEVADGALFTELEECLKREDFQGAIIQLLPLFAVVDSKSEVIRCYELLFQLLPHFDSLDLLVNNLPHLLSCSRFMPEYQERLALELALFHLSRNAYVDAMHCFAKALQINRSQANYRSASKLFVTLLHLRLDGFLINSTPSVETIQLGLEEMQTFKRFCLSKPDLSPFYQKMLSRIAQIPFDRQEAYAPSRQTILEEQAKPFQEPDLFAIERYWNAFQEMRSHFTSSTEEVRAFQKNTLEKFKEFFNGLLKDAFALIGPAPCAYDIRAMGSAGREELCPYSDLELMILIEDALHKDYFKRLVTLLEIQIASLGETQHLPFLFTCLKEPNPSGLHIDNSPNQEERLIQIPEAMAKMQTRPGVCPQEIEHTVLKSMSLAQNSSKLYEEYRTELKVTLLHKERAFTFFKHRLRDFKENWKSSFHPNSSLISIKTHFVEVLNHLLSDMALFCGIEKTNTLDIIEALVESKIFNEASGQLLQESVAKIYAIRVRLHLHYQSQKEEASCSPSLKYAQLQADEIKALEKCYWLVLVPLYKCMEKVTSPEEFKKVFDQFNLIEVAFTIQSPPIIKQIARHLSAADIETHL